MSSHLPRENQGPLLDPLEGFPFTAESPLRRHAEPASFALYPYIAGLTVMNDHIAAAVDKHSGFRERPWERLLSTADAAVTLVFGNEQESLKKSEQLWEFHKTVRGTNEAVDYSANDTDLQVWVLASIFKGLEGANDRWAKPLGSDRDAFYQDIRIFGTVFGIPTDEMPPDAEALDTYWEEAVDGESLLRTEVSRRMARTVFRFTSSKVPAPIARLGQAVAVTSLDRRLRERAEIKLMERDVRLAAIFDTAMHRTYQRVPQSLRERAIPSYLALRRRVKI